MHDLVTNETFDLEKTYEYRLSIQVSLDGFSFFIELPGENKLLAFKNSPLKISSGTLLVRHFKEWITRENILQKPFKKIRIIVYGEKFTLVPEKIFQNTLKSEIPRFLFDKNADLEIAENIIGKLESRLIFVLPTGINSVFREQIGECEIVHPVKIILNNLPKTKKEYGLILLFDAKFSYILCFNTKKILLTNSFKPAHVNDVVYYVLTTLKQLEILYSETELFLVGSHKKYPEIKDALKSYFSEIKGLGFTPFLSDQKMIAYLKN